MEGSKLLTMIVTVTVGVIFIGALLGPVINDVSETQGTYTNNGYYTMKRITADDTDEYTLTWVRSTDVFTLNGEVVDIGDHSQYSDSLGVSVAMTDVSVSRYVSGLRVQTWISNIGGSFGYSATTMTINFNNGTMTVTADEGLESEANRSTTYEYAYFISNTGDYEMKAKDKTAAVKADSELYAVGVTYINNSTAPSTPILSVLKMTGDASEVEFSAIYGLSGTITFDDIEIHKTANSKFVGVYDLEKVTATATYDDAETSLTYSYFIVPKEITAEYTQHLDAGEIALLAVLPLIAITALLLLAVRFFVGRD